MKSYNHLYEKVITRDNIRLAIHNASKKKRGRRVVNAILADPEPHITRIIEMIENGEVLPSPHKEVQRFDPMRKKWRRIVPPNFYRDMTGRITYEQVIQHAVMQVLSPIIMKGMHRHSYGSIPGRGPHMGKRAIANYIANPKNEKKIKYVLKCDIRKFYESVDIGVLKALIAKTSHDVRFNNLLYALIDSNIVEENGKIVRRPGLPIGFYISQWLANWVLQGMDHFIKEELGAEFYVRYMDDFVIFGGNKRKLHRMRRAIAGYIGKIGLELKDNWQVFLFDYEKKGRPLDFMGFKFYRNRTVLRKGILRRMRRTIVAIVSRGLSGSAYWRQRLSSYRGWMGSADVRGWWGSLFQFRASW